ARRMRRASDGPKPNYITSGLGCLWLGGSLTRAKCIFGGPSRSAAAKRRERSSYALPPASHASGAAKARGSKRADCLLRFTGGVRYARSERGEGVARGVGVGTSARTFFLMQLPSKQEGRSHAEVSVALQIHRRGKKGVDEGESRSTRSCSEINNPDGTRVTVISDPRMLCGQPRGIPTRQAFSRGGRIFSRYRLMPVEV